MKNYYKLKYIVFSIAFLMIFHFSAQAAETIANTKPSDAMNSDSMIRWILAGVVALFAFMIAILSNAIKMANDNYQKRMNKEKNNSSKILSILLFLCLMSTSLFAQPISKETSKFSFSNWDIYLFVTIILLLFVVVLTLVKTLFVLMGIKKEAVANTEEGSSKIKTWFQKLNETVPIEDEADLDMSHDYDGIRELDNKIPSWWTWTFLSTVLFAIVYLYRMFGSETLPNQFVELAQANEIAAQEKLEYLKKGANNVDENTVKMLGEAEIAEGAAIYAKNCVACHGDKGQGGVGSNLTDDYWLHKGSLKDIFYSIKYGWAEKGMKSWKEELSPGQIAQVASFIKTLKGTTPPNPKEKQGELYSEEASNNTDGSKIISADTSAVKK